MRQFDNIFLTEREKDIVSLLLEGKTKQEIAQILALSISTIKTNIENIYKKTGVHNKVELIIYLVKNNIVKLM